MEAQRERLRGERLHRVLAAYVVAAAGDVHAAPVDRDERLLPAVVTDLQPMRAVGLLALPVVHGRAMPEPGRLQLGEIHVGNHQGGARGSRARGVAPWFST